MGLIIQFLQNYVSVQCQIVNMDGNHRVMDNGHIEMGFAHKWQGFLIFLPNENCAKREGARL
jgi:hypothetical protein